MTDLTKNFKHLNASDLLDACIAKGIEADVGDDRDTLLEKLKPLPKSKK